MNKLTDRDYTIVKYVAHFYEVKIETIKTILKRNYHIFVDNGYEVLSGSTLNECKKNNQNHFSSMTSTIGLLNNKCVVIFAYFLRKSNKTLTIIKENDIRNHEFHEKIMGLYTSNDFVKKYEKEMGFLIHSIFDKFHKIEEQVSCGGYYIDFVIDNKLAIECDENNHYYYDKNKEIDREKFLRKSGYEVMRYNTVSNNMLGFMGEISDFFVSH